MKNPNENHLQEMMADILYDIGYCADWADLSDKGMGIVLCDVVGKPLGDTEEFIPRYDGNDKAKLKIAVQQITTLEQWVIRTHFDLWSKYSHPAYFGEDEDLLSIVQQVVFNTFEELSEVKH